MILFNMCDVQSGNALIVICRRIRGVKYVDQIQLCDSGGGCSASEQRLICRRIEYMRCKRSHSGRCKSGN